MTLAVLRSGSAAAQKWSGNGRVAARPWLGSSRGAEEAVAGNVLIDRENVKIGRRKWLTDYRHIVECQEFNCHAGGHRRRSAAPQPRTAAKYARRRQL